MRFSLIMAILVVLICAVNSGFAQNPDTLRIESVIAQICDIVEVPIYLANNSDSIIAFLLKIGYEPDKLTPIDLRLTGRGLLFDDPPYNQWAYTIRDFEPGAIRVYGVCMNGDFMPIGDGSFIIMRFAVAENALLWPSPIWFQTDDAGENALSSDESELIFPELIDGEVVITTGETDDICPCVFVPGDVNGDSSVIGGDVTYLVNYFRGTGNPPVNSCWNCPNCDWLYSAADVNGDCFAIGSDVTFLVNYFKGVQSEIQYCPHTPPMAYLNHAEIRGECLGGITAEVDSGYMEIEVVGNDLHIYHINAYYQCCLEYYVEYEINGNDITATEFDLGELCDCYCPFNLESILFNLDPGAYTIRLIGISGGLIGEDTFTIGD